MKYPVNFMLAIAAAMLIIFLDFYGCTSQPPQSVNPTNPKVTPSIETVSPKDKQAKNVIKMVNFKYEPANLTVKIGETVKIVNKDEEPHTFTAKDGSFNSKGLDQNESWTYTFNKPGMFLYFCTIHPYMKGTVIVEPVGEKK